MARGRGEYTFKQLGAPLLEKTVGDATYRLIVEYDTAAETPESSLRLRAGRLLNPGDPVELLKSPGVATFNGDNVDALLAIWPDFLAKVSQFKHKLPKRSKNGPVKSNTVSSVEAELAKQFATPAADLPAAPVASGGRRAKRAF